MSFFKIAIQAFVLMVSFAVSPLWAVQPDEMLADPGLEARARMISREIRCPVCQGESIDDSHAQISRDLRLIIRERLLAGDSNDEVIDYVVMRYGEFVLFNPRASGWNWVLWLAGPVSLLVVGGAAFLVIRARQRENLPAAAALSEDEEARLAALLKGDAPKQD